MSDESGYLTDVAEVLWPCGGLLGRGGGSSAVTGRLVWARHGTEVREYLPVPSADSPRIILPTRNRYAAARGIAAFAKRHSFGQRLRATLAGVAFASGLAPLLLRDRLRVASGHTIEHALSTALGQDLVIAVHMGPPRANRKPVLLLLTPGGQPLGYAKIGVSELTARLVVAETEALQRLARTRLPDVTVPRLLHAGEWMGWPYLVQEALPVGEQTHRPTRHQLLRCVVQIAAIEDITQRALATSAYRRDLRDRIAALDRRAEATALRSALDRLPDARLPFGSWHGDLTRWNLASTPRRAFVWDWERLTMGVPVGFDALHYELHETVRVDARSGVRRWLENGARLLGDPLLATTGLRAECVPVVMALYLIDLATRYLQDRQEETGGLTAVGDWLLPALAGVEERIVRG